MQRFSLALEAQQFAYSPCLPPRFAARDGETVEVETMDAFCNLATPSTQSLAALVKPGDNPLVGPICVEGAQPGDALKIEILAIRPARDYAISGILPAFGSLTANAMTPMLNAPLEEKCFCYRFDGPERLRFNERLSFSYRPFVGSIATAPAVGAPRSVEPFCNGGNMDVPDVCPGNALYLPICVPGGYLYLGDVHARQGQDEACGSALEISALVQLRLSVLKGLALGWPRIESPEEIMCVGSAKPMDDSARIACYELLRWLVELGWERCEVYQAITQAGELYVANMANSAHSLVAKMRKDIALRGR